MKGNILFVGLDYHFLANVASKFSDIVDMFFLDVNNLIEYSLIDSKNVEILCGESYLKKQKKAIALSVAKYENTVSSFPYSLFLQRGVASKLMPTALVIYLKVPKSQLEKSQKNSLDAIIYEEVDELLIKKSDIVVECESLCVDNCVNRVINKIKEMR